MAKLTVSIVNYNAGDYLIKCLRSLEKVNGEVSMDIWLVDNSSTDGSATRAREKFPKLNLVFNKENVGFSKANNQVLKGLLSEYILILNPDCELRKGVIREMIKFMDGNQKVGAVTCKVLLPNGQLDWATHRGFPSPWASFLYYFLRDDSLYHLTNQDIEKTHKVDSISGSFFLTRKKVLSRVGLFDEQFFMYGEDVDLCWRINDAGYKVMFNPTVSIIHHKGVSSGLKKHSQGITQADQQTRVRALDAFYQAMKIFYQKHYQKKYPFIINWLVYLGINLKWWLAKRKLTV